MAKYDTRGALVWYQHADSSVPYFDDVDIADAGLHRSGDVFLAVNTEVSNGTAHGAWGIKFDVVR